MEVTAERQWKLPELLRGRAAMLTRRNSDFAISKTSKPTMTDNDHRRRSTGDRRLLLMQKSRRKTTHCLNLSNAKIVDDFFAAQCSPALRPSSQAIFLMPLRQARQNSKDQEHLIKAITFTNSSAFRRARGEDRMWFGQTRGGGVEARESSCGMPKDLISMCCTKQINYCSNKGSFTTVSTTPDLQLAAQGPHCDAIDSEPVSNCTGNSTHFTLTTKVTTLLDKSLSLWDFPIFDFCLFTGGHPLTAMAYDLFQKADLFRKLQIETPAFISFFCDLEEHYLSVAYHNRLHATDVLHAMAYLLQQPIIGLPLRHFATSRCEEKAATLVSHIRKLVTSEELVDLSQIPSEAVGSLASLLSPIELAACFVAAAAHDCDHPGRTYNFVNATEKDLSSLYHGISILENHHIVATWRLLSKPANNFLNHLSAEKYQSFKGMVEDLILVTDLGLHEAVMQSWGTLLAETKETGFCLNEANNHGRLLFILQQVIRIADVSAAAKNLQIYLKWSSLLYHEFDAQADEAVHRDLPVEKHVDPKTRSIPLLQVAFIESYVLQPLEMYNEAGLLPGPYVFHAERRVEDVDDHEGHSPFRALNQFISSVILKNVTENHDYWNSFTHELSEAISEAGDEDTTSNEEEEEEQDDSKEESDKHKEQP